jgi:glycosyltransferase involved in cell wall biosynthesis
MHLHTTGFVASQSGSVASANALILKELLRNGHRITFYTKPSFVDPRLDVTEPELAILLDVIDCTNEHMDGLWRRHGGRQPGLKGSILGRLNAVTYNRGLVKAMRQDGSGDIDLWLGDWAYRRGRRPVVSFVQGPPGTDADSILRHKGLIIRLAGRATYLKLRAYAVYRLSLGLPRFRYSDAVIVGSEWSRQRLITRHGLLPQAVHAIPYPIDLQRFTPSSESRDPKGRLRLLWLGRFVPRKRLDLLLDGLAMAIRDGCDAELWVVGKSGFVPNFERLLEEFPFQDRLRHWESMPREKVPALLADVDVLVQPSENEDFGSSVAEALACGVPSIVGATNGTGDYICDSSIRLADYQVATMASAIRGMAQRKGQGMLEDTSVSRKAATAFDPWKIAASIESVLNMSVVQKGSC